MRGIRRDGSETFNTPSNLRLDAPTVARKADRERGRGRGKRMGRSRRAKAEITGQQRPASGGGAQWMRRAKLHARPRARNHRPPLTNRRLVLRCRAASGSTVVLLLCCIWQLAARNTFHLSRVALPALLACLPPPRRACPGRGCVCVCPSCPRTCIAVGSC